MNRRSIPGETLLVATRNPHKLREIAAMLDDASITLRSLVDLELPALAGEDEVERYETFEENALAKARFYRRHTGMAVVADDSGLCVDALDGGPGVLSKRFAPEGRGGTRERDEANNVFLLEQLRDVPDDRRGAHYRCALALVGDRRTLLLRGRVDGFIARAPSGTEGFGYDPLFVVPAYGRTFGDLPPGVKASISHRAAAVRSFRRWIAPLPHSER